CTLEPSADDFALRMGLAFVKQLGFGEGAAIVSARREAPFTSLADFRRRVKLRSSAARALAEAGAFETLEHGRRAALCRASRAADCGERAVFACDDASVPEFEALDEHEIVSWDYAASRHSVRAHPLATLRAELTAAGLPDARTVATLEKDTVVRY